MPRYRLPVVVTPVTTADGRIVPVDVTGALMPIDGPQETALIAMGGILASQKHGRTSAQLAGVPTPQDIAADAVGAIFYASDIAVTAGAPRVDYTVSSDGTKYVAKGGSSGGGITALSQASDYAANLQTPLNAATAAISQIGKPVAISTATTLAATHNGENLVCASTPALTINTGLANGFGCSIKGAFTTAGTATISDLRATTGTAMCCLVQTDTAGTGLTYDLVGTK